MIDEGDVKGRIVNDELSPFEELHEIIDHVREPRLIAQKLAGDAMYLESTELDLAVWLQVVMKSPRREASVDKLHAVVRLHLELVGQDRALAHILQIETRHSRRFMNLLTRGRLDDYFSLIRSVIVEGQKSGAFRTDIRPGLAIVFVFGAVDEAVTSWLLADEPGDLSRHVKPLASLLTTGIVPRNNK